MKRMISLGIMSLMVSPLAFAIPPVMISGPMPAIASSYMVGTTNTVIYTITNNVPKTLPLTVSGISGPITRIPVANDCGTTLPAGTASCKIGIAITPRASDVGSFIGQTLKVDYQGRIPLTRAISFTVKPALPSEPTLVYVGTGYDHHVYLCNLNNIGIFSNCKPTPVPTPGAPSASWVPEGIDFATFGGKLYAYMTDWPNQNVYQCNVNANGTFSGCTPFSLAFNTEGITIGMVNGTQYAYISDDNEAVYRCTLNSNGTFNNSMCAATPTGTPLWDAPVQTLFKVFGSTQYVYVADPGNCHIYRCGLNPNGTFNGPSCMQMLLSNEPNWCPQALMFSTTAGVQYAYVADEGGDHVWQCGVNPANGSLTACQQMLSGGGEPNWRPSMVTVATFSGMQYAYVASFGNHGVFRCSVNPIDGKFVSCALTPAAGAPTGVQTWWINFR